MASEFEKTLKKLNVSFTSKELTGTPAQGFTPSARYWRVALVRELRGQDKALRLTLTLVSESEPTAETVVHALDGDIQAAKLSLWDFAQAYAAGKTSESIERMYKTCKRTEPRVTRFFGEQWAKVIATAPKAA